MLGYFSWKFRLPLAAILGMLAMCARAQTQDYHVSEDYQPDAATADAGPVRMARISFIEGSVSWRPSGDGDWAAASVNLPMRQGAQLWVSDHARAEIQFDDGSIARLGSAARADGGVVTLQTLYSDSKGEFTELSLSSGLIALHLVNAQSLYQVDTSALSAKAYGPAKFRVGVGQGVEVADRDGEVSVQNNATNALVLESRNSVFASDTDTAMNATTVPMEDSFDLFVDYRDSQMFGHAGYVPANIAVCAGNLGDSGAWRSGQYGQTWYPRVAAGWAPYHYGHWVFVRPFGWTWCSDESWGWAPYHYGTWVYASAYGWGWVPGPAQQCWSPAVVHFTSYNGQVAWCALAPAEVHYASVGVYLGGGLSIGFSIGSVGCYYPATNAYCVPRTFNNIQVNRVTTVTNITTINNYYGATSAVPTHFVPQNAGANGASFVQSGRFGQGGTPEILGRNQTVAFSQGQSLVPQGNRVMSGPPGVQVSHESFTPTHSFTSSAPPAGVLTRPVVRPNLPPAISQVSAPTHTQFVTPRQSGSVRSNSTNIPTRPSNPVRQSNPTTGFPSRTQPSIDHTSKPTNSGLNKNRPSGSFVPSKANSSNPNQNRPGGDIGGNRPSSSGANTPRPTGSFGGTNPNSASRPQVSTASTRGSSSSGSRSSSKGSNHHNHSTPKPKSNPPRDKSKDGQ